MVFGIALIKFYHKSIGNRICKFNGGLEATAVSGMVIMMDLMLFLGETKGRIASKPQMELMDLVGIISFLKLKEKIIN